VATYTTAQMMASLGISGLSLRTLRRNAAFPATTSDDGKGNITVDTVLFGSFPALWNSAKANGWNLVAVAAYPSMNLATMAITPVGTNYDLDPLQARLEANGVGVLFLLLHRKDGAHVAVGALA
jgi:hypothetical protein